MRATPSDDIALSTAMMIFNKMFLANTVDTDPSSANYRRFDLQGASVTSTESSTSKNIKKSIEISLY
jgi:hypothetical protein